MQQDLIYDVGMNNGADTAYYLARGYRVVSIEADVTLVDDARKRFAAEIAAGRLTLLNIAVGAENTTAKFWICPQMKVWNSFDESYAARWGLPHHAVDVQVKKFGDVMREHGVPMYLKVDIEGFDHYCLSAIEAADPPKFVSFEITTIKDIGTLMERGYNAFKCISQRRFVPIKLGSWRGSTTHLPPESLLRRVRKLAASNQALRAAIIPIRDALRKPKASSPAPSKVPVAPEPSTAESAGPPVSTIRWNGGEWGFPFGSSGPFGDDLPGPWLTGDEVAYQWLDFWLYSGRFRGVGDRDWFDVHATILPQAQAPRIAVLEF